MTRKYLNTEEMDARKQVYSHIVEDVLQDEGVLEAWDSISFSAAFNSPK